MPTTTITHSHLIIIRFYYETLFIARQAGINKEINLNHSHSQPTLITYSDGNQKIKSFSFLKFEKKKAAGVGSKVDFHCKTNLLERASDRVRETERERKRVYSFASAH